MGRGGGGLTLRWPEWLSQDSSETGESDTLFCGVWRGEWLGVDTGLPSGEGLGLGRGLHAKETID